MLRNKHPDLTSLNAFVTVSGREQLTFSSPLTLYANSCLTVFLQFSRIWIRLKVYILGTSSVSLNNWWICTYDSLGEYRLHHIFPSFYLPIWSLKNKSLMRTIMYLITLLYISFFYQNYHWQDLRYISEIEIKENYNEKGNNSKLFIENTVILLVNLI